MAYQATITKRIQRKRVKGWRMPSETVYVGRPSHWANPYTAADYSRKGAIEEYAKWLGRRVRLDPHFLDPLFGKDLACWCRPGEPCHADLLLKIVEMERAKLSGKINLYSEQSEQIEGPEAQVYPDWRLQETEK